MRLRPLTNEIQKCLLPIGGKPMLEWWLDSAFASAFFTEIYVNIHYLGNDVKNWLYHYEQKTGNYVSIIDERAELLGTAGTLRKYASRDEDFMIAYTDTFSTKVLDELCFYAGLWQDQRQDVMAGLLSMNPPNDGSASAIVLDSIGQVVQFTEKSDEGTVSWMGVMFARPDFLDHIQPGDRDLARDVFPRLAGKMRVIAHVDAYDIGRGVEHYERLRNSFQTAKI